MIIMLSAFIKQHHLPENFECTVAQYYQPLADRIFNQFSKINRTFAEHVQERFNKYKRMFKNVQAILTNVR